MAEFQAVRCPFCPRRPVVLEIATGLSRGKCPDCRKRIWVSKAGPTLHIGMVDDPLARVAT